MDDIAGTNPHPVKRLKKYTGRCEIRGLHMVKDGGRLFYVDVSLAPSHRGLITADV